MDVYGTKGYVAAWARHLLSRFQGFEWSVRDVHKLRNVVEGDDSTQEETSDFEILKQSPVLGDNKFKLEIGQFYSIWGVLHA